MNLNMKVTVTEDLVTENTKDFLINFKKRLVDARSSEDFAELIHWTCVKFNHQQFSISIMALLHQVYEDCPHAFFVFMYSNKYPEEEKGLVEDAKLIFDNVGVTREKRKEWFCMLMF